MTRLRASLRAREVEHGATSAEYALMASLVAVVIIASVLVFGEQVRDLFVIPAGAI